MMTNPLPTRLAKGVRLAILSTLVGPAMASASNGYFSFGWGTVSKAMAGVATALPQDTLVTGTNPAGMAWIDTSLDLGVALFNPSPRGYEADNDYTPGYPFVAPGKYDSDSDWFLIPSFGYNRVLNDRMTLGMAVFGNGGMNTDYNERPVWEYFAPPPGPYNPNGIYTATTPTGVNLEQLFIEVPFTYKVTDQHALALAPVFAVQSFEAEGLQPFRQMSLHPNAVTNNGKDWSYGLGVQVGWMGKINEVLSLGASYRTKLWMTEFDDYEGLFAEGGDFDIPAMLNLGLSVKLRPDLVVAFDWQRIFYSDVNAVGNSNNANIMPCLMPGPKASFCLGGDQGLGFGWDDMDVFKLGVRWDYNRQWSFMAGASHASDFAPGGEGLFNVLAPATIKWTFTLGASYRHSEADSFNISLAYMPEEEVYDTSPNITGSQTGALYMEQKEIEVSWHHRF